MWKRERDMEATILPLCTLCYGSQKKEQCEVLTIKVMAQLHAGQSLWRRSSRQEPQRFLTDKKPYKLAWYSGHVSVRPIHEVKFQSRSIII
ncbi:hypothetical protein NC652_000131 [Populus alba x Populus x berolinensis]|nr:hypothetical protein NC652_000127 [Populus alba x Populus x berolinensis]KAJ6961138.1 hypothetical protein NC652_000131 [Populus alba x Populus x berolinensis]